MFFILAHISAGRDCAGERLRSHASHDVDVDVDVDVDIDVDVDVDVGVGVDVDVGDDIDLLLMLGASKNLRTFCCTLTL